MTYNEAEDLVKVHSAIIGKPQLNKMAFMYDRKITSLLISPVLTIKQVFSAWWFNGNDNKKAVPKTNKHTNFEVFVISYNPGLDNVIYYLKLSKYLELEQ